METTAEVEVDQAAKRSETKMSSSADISDAKVTSTKNIMFPSLSDDMLLKIVDVGCHGKIGNSSKQSR